MPELYAPFKRKFILVRVLVFIAWRFLVNVSEDTLRKIGFYLFFLVF